MLPRCVPSASENFFLLSLNSPSANYAVRTNLTAGANYAGRAPRSEIGHIAQLYHLVNSRRRRRRRRRRQRERERECERVSLGPAVEGNVSLSVCLYVEIFHWVDFSRL